MCEICRQKCLNSYGKERAEEPGTRGRAELANWSVRLPPEKERGMGCAGRKSLREIQSDHKRIASQ